MSTHSDPESWELRRRPGSVLYERYAGGRGLEADLHALLRWTVKGSRVLQKQMGMCVGLHHAQAAVCGRLVLIAALHKYVESSRALPAQLEHLQVHPFFFSPLFGSRTRLASNIGIVQCVIFTFWLLLTGIRLRSCDENPNRDGFFHNVTNKNKKRSVLRV